MYVRITWVRIIQNQFVNANQGLGTRLVLINNAGRAQPQIIRKNLERAYCITGVRSSPMPRLYLLRLSPASGRPWARRAWERGYNRLQKPDNKARWELVWFADQLPNVATAKVRITETVCHCCFAKEDTTYKQWTQQTAKESKGYTCISGP